MSEQVKPVDLEAARLWLSHDRQDNLTLEFGKRLIVEVEALRARVIELESKEASGKINKDLEAIVREEIPAICEENKALRARVKELEAIIHESWKL